MLKKKKVFLEILKLELEDLEEDTKMLIREYTEKHDREEITNYVFRRNISVMQSEIFGVEGFLEDVRGVDPETYNTLEDLVDVLLTKLNERIKVKGLPKSLLYLVERKIKKVANYVNQTADYC